MLRPITDARDWVALTDEPLPVDDAAQWATVARAGAVVTFTGVVRDHAEGRPGVVGMTYEAYVAPAVRALGEIAGEIRSRWPEVERIALLHRVGDLQLSEASVVVVVSAPHRGDAFAAAEFAIDTLKESVPIWKQEHWTGGSDWAVVGSIFGISVVLLRNRRPNSMEHSIGEFERNLRALAPDAPARRRRRSE